MEQEGGVGGYVFMYRVQPEQQKAFPGAKLVVARGGHHDNTPTRMGRHLRAPSASSPRAVRAVSAALGIERSTSMAVFTFDHAPQSSKIWGLGPPSFMCARDYVLAFLALPLPQTRKTWRKRRFCAKKCILVYYIQTYKI